MTTPETDTVPVTRIISEEPDTPSRYGPLPYLQARQYHLACFLLENLGLHYYFSWSDIERARRKIASSLGVEWYDPLVGKWDEGRPPPWEWQTNYKGLIVCQDCGTAYGRNTHHSTSSYHKVVWECCVSHKKRGTCGTGWLPQKDLHACFFQFLLRRLRAQPALIATICDALTEVSSVSRLEVLAHVTMALNSPPEELVCQPEDVLAHVASGMVTLWRTLILTSTDGHEEELLLPLRWHR